MVWPFFKCGLSGVPKEISMNLSPSNPADEMLAIESSAQHIFVPISRRPSPQ